MSSYTGTDRVIAAVKRRYADMVPATLMFGSYGAILAGFTLREFYTSAEKHVRSAVRVYEMFQPDTIDVGGDDYMETEALGAEVEFPEDATVHLKSHVLEDKATLAKLDIPDPPKHPRLSWYLEACELAMAEFKDAGVPVGGNAAGPWTIATNLRGTERLIYDTVDDPNFVHEVMRFTTELLKVWIAAVRETGVGLALGEAAASCSVISPKIYRAFVKPYHEELVKYFRERKLWLGFHICGYIDPIMEDVIETGTGLLSIDSPSSLRRLVEVSENKKKVVIMGNVATSLFAEGTKEEIEAATKECIDVAAEGSGYILSSGCNVPLNTSKENVISFFEAARKYGRYS